MTLLKSFKNIQQFTKTLDGGNTWTPGNINVGNTGLGISMIKAIFTHTLGGTSSNIMGAVELLIQSIQYTNEIVHL